MMGRLVENFVDRGATGQMQRYVPPSRRRGLSEGSEAAAAELRGLEGAAPALSQVARCMHYGWPAIGRRDQVWAAFKTAASGSRQWQPPVVARLHFCYLELCRAPAAHALTP